MRGMSKYTRWRVISRKMKRQVGKNFEYVCIRDVKLKRVVEIGLERRLDL